MSEERKVFPLNYSTTHQLGTQGRASTMTTSFMQDDSTGEILKVMEKIHTLMGVQRAVGEIEQLQEEITEAEIHITNYKDDIIKSEERFKKEFTDAYGDSIPYEMQTAQKQQLVNLQSGIRSQELGIEARRLRIAKSNAMIKDAYGTDKLADNS